MIRNAIIVGAGVIGCAVARALAGRRPGWKILVLEKEPDVARHTSGRNSGVIHSGFNAAPGTLKARFCVEGNRRLRAYCKERGVAMQEVGTVVVAQNDGDEKVLEELARRGRENGVPGIGVVDQKRLRELEPHASGESALHSPSGSIVDSTGVVRAYAEDAKNAGVEFAFFNRVTGVDPSGGGYRVRTDSDAYECGHFINCAGLHADRIAHFLGVAADVSIFPFRGDYFQLAASKSHLVRSMIYPAPNIKYPFLGIHFTKKITGEVLAGPNAVLAMGRESYRPLDVDFRDTVEMALDARFWKMIGKREFLSLAWEQLSTSLFKRVFLDRARRILPQLEPPDITRGRSGNRAQLVNRHGELVEDLVVECQGRSTHILNAVSPGLTCSLPFADYIVDEVLKRE